jgi:antitoxin component YwqK of YwqJK toxin-antitoxin module
MVSPQRDGLTRTFREDGSLLAETTYQGGCRHGPFRDYWSNGQLACEGVYVDDVQEGEWRFYHPDGSLREVVQFRGGREVVDWYRFFQRARGQE